MSTVPGVSTPQHGARSAWRVATSRNFGPYFVGNAISASGSWFQNLAASVLVFQLTHSPFLLGVVSFCQFAPVLLLAPWAGRVADTYDRRTVLLITQPPVGGIDPTPDELRNAAWLIKSFAMSVLPSESASRRLRGAREVAATPSSRSIEFALYQSGGRYAI